MSPISAIPPAITVYGAGPVETTRLHTPDMPGPIPIGQPGLAAPVQPAGDSFATMLGRFVQDVNAKQIAASDSVNALQSGQPVPLHQAMIAMEEASVSFQLMVEVRNKLLESYQELMRMQI